MTVRKPVEINPEIKDTENMMNFQERLTGKFVTASSFLTDNSLRRAPSVDPSNCGLFFFGSSVILLQLNFKRTFLGQNWHRTVEKCFFVQNTLKRKRRF